jgi:poly-beta-1,6-N-acetyl-D-glucosamine synthase
MYITMLPRKSPRRPEATLAAPLRREGTRSVSLQFQSRAPEATTRAPASVNGGHALPDGGNPLIALECSVGVMAYNEEANIGVAVKSVLDQALSTTSVAELIVVASGCEDRTADVVSEISRRDGRVRLIEQQRREGKASAINLFIAAAESPILVMVSGDVLLKEGALQALLRHFADPTVGMVGGHPIPVNDETTLLGHAVHLQWRLHDRIARESAKLGEVVAFRNVVPSIPVDTAVDEISIQAIVTQLGYRLVYEPEAIVFNRGPSTVSDFIRQRRRIYAGHLRVAEQQHYAAPTMDAGRVLRAFWGSGSFSTPRAAVWSMSTAWLEVIARALGSYDVSRGRSPHVWQISPTTKRYISEGANGQGQNNVLVFHIADYHRLQLELGAHVAGQLTKRAADRIRRDLGPATTVAVKASGTIVALVPGDRAHAQETAHAVVRDFEEAPATRIGHGTTVTLGLACGVIAFPRAGPPLAQSVPAAVLAPATNSLSM